jgi:hypothetical protein
MSPSAAFLKNIRCTDSAGKVKKPFKQVQVSPTEAQVA